MVDLITVTPDDAFDHHSAGRLQVLGALLSPGCRTTVTDRLVAIGVEQLAWLIPLARAHGVEAWLAGHAPRGEAWGALHEQRARFAAARVRALAELQAVGAVLDKINCPWAVLKGQALAEDAYPRPYLRYGLDDDVLVPAARFGDVIEALTAVGWTLLDRNWPLIRRILPGELRLQSPRGRLLDLHWHLLDAPKLRDAYVLPTEPLLARRRAISSGLPALDPADQLVHVAVHAAQSGATRLSWLLDTILSLRASPDWGCVTRAVRQARAQHALALVVARANRWLATPSPDVGAGPAWWAVCRAVDRLSPLGARPDAPSLARSFARSTMPGTLASVAELVRHGSAWTGAGRPQTPQMPANRSASDPRSPLHPVPDVVAQRQYLAIIEASADARSDAFS